MKFLIDANLPRALAAWIAAGGDAGDDVAYIDDLLSPPAADDDIWNLALAQGAVVVTKDADFAVRAARDDRVRVVWIRCGNLKLKLFEAWFAARTEAMRRLLAMDERVVELR